MTRAFVFTNHKGGIGKSTSATNIALGIAGMLQRAGAPNARVLLIDTEACWSCCRTLAAKVAQVISATTPQELARALMRQESDQASAHADQMRTLPSPLAEASSRPSGDQARS